MAKPTCETIISCLKTEIPGNYKIIFTQGPDNTVIGQGGYIEDKGTATWKLDGDYLVTFFESKRGMSRAKALRVVNNFNAHNEFKSHMVHIYLRDDNRINIFMKQRIIYKADDGIYCEPDNIQKRLLGGSSIVGLTVLGWWNGLCVDESQRDAEETARKAAQAVLELEEMRRRQESESKKTSYTDTNAWTTTPTVVDREKEKEQKRKDEENRKKAEKEKKIAEYEMKIARMRSEVSDAEARVADLKTRVGKFLSFTSKSDVERARADVARKKAELAKLRLELKELKG